MNLFDQGTTGAFVELHEWSEYRIGFSYHLIYCIEHSIVLNASLVIDVSERHDTRFRAW